MRIPIPAVCGAVLVGLAVSIAGPAAAPALAAPAAAPATAVASSVNTMLQLPFPCGETWRGNGTASSRHVGTEIDFNWGAGSQDLGRRVVAAAAGTVQFAGNKGSGYGNYVQIEHPNRTYTLYAHLGKNLSVRPGMKIAQGTPVGTVGGSSGFSGSTAVHLHFEHKTSPRQAGFIRAAFDGKPFPYAKGDVQIKSNNCGTKPKPPAPPAGHTALAALDGRTSRDPGNHAYKDLYPAGRPVPVVCKSTGKTGYPDPTWALTADHVWVAGQYLAHAGGKRGVAPSVRTCTVPLPARALDDLNSRKSKDMNDVDVPDRYRKDQPVPVICTALGGATGPGLHTWARTADKTWVPARYLDLKLGKDGHSPALPRCDKDKAGQTGGPRNTAVGSPGARRDGSTWNVSEKGIAFIAGQEGFRGRHYNDAGRNCTVGYGRLVHRGPCTRAELAKPALTEAEAMRWLRAQLAGKYRTATRQVVGGLPLSQNEFDAIASMVYNLGPGALLTYQGKPTEFITALRSGTRAYSTIPARMENFSSEGGRYNCGLNKRRQREGRIWAVADYDARKVTSCRSR